MPEVLTGWENFSQRLVPALRAGRLGFIEDVEFMCNAVRRGGAGAHTWRIHCLARVFYTASRRKLPCRWRILSWVGFQVARDAGPSAWFKMQGL